MYVPGISSAFMEAEHKAAVLIKLQDVKEDIDSLVHWDKQCVDEFNVRKSENKCKYNDDYLELQRIVNKVLGQK